MREERLLNNDWKFAYGSYTPQDMPDLEGWSDVGIPHSFGIPYFMENEFYVGYGTYQREVVLSEEDVKKRILLEFLGVFQEAEIFWNGKPAGSHKGGYTPFIVELTDSALVGKNQLLVRVNNFWNPRLAPRAGEHQFNGGIYRDVQLLLTERDCVDWMGTFVKTDSLTGDRAELSVETTVRIEQTEGKQVSLESVIWFGQEELSVSRMLLENKPLQNVTQSFSLEGVKTWSPEAPWLYELVSRVLVDGEEKDCYRTSFGIRTVRFDKDKGFFLNGRHTKVLGANVHQDHAGWADAVTHSGITRDIKRIKDCGMNFIRGSHYPHHPFFAEECDRLGVMFWSELCFWGTAGAKKDGYWTSSGYPVHTEDQAPFEESCLRMLEEMILVNRNHPSIIIWSMCNEPFFSEQSVWEPAKALIRRLVARSHELDSTRPAAVGGAQRGGFDVLGDVAGYNGDGASLFPDPGFPNFVSEYGSTVAFRPGEADPRYTDGVEQDFAWRSGKALWCGFHHGSILGNMGAMGMIDYYRLPLNTWYWYRKELKGIPFPPERKKGTPKYLRLTSDVAQFAAKGQEDAWLYAEVLDADLRPLSNELEVTLTVISGDGIFPTGKAITFRPEDNSFLDGQCAIEFRSYYGGDNIIEASAKGLESARIHIRAVGTPRVRTLVPMTLPPYLTPQPTNEEEYNLAVDKPVFASSYRKGYPPMSVTKEGADIWLPEQENAWLKLDLEGDKTITRIEVFPEAEDLGEECEVFLSSDTGEEMAVRLKSQFGGYALKGEWSFRYLIMSGVCCRQGVRLIRLWTR